MLWIVVCRSVTGKCVFDGGEIGSTDAETTKVDTVRKRRTARKTRTADENFAFEDYALAA